MNFIIANFQQNILVVNDEQTKGGMPWYANRIIFQIMSFFGLGWIPQRELITGTCEVDFTFKKYIHM
jgi:hypothetical protein